MNVDHLNWRLVVPVTQNSRVLNLGPEVDSRLLLDFCGEVVEVGEGRPPSDDSHNRVERVQGGIYDKALTDDSFDLAVLYGVGRWLCCAGVAGHPHAEPLDVLRRIRALLRCGGYLCLGMENRWYYRNFLGLRDPCSGIPFGAILPRPISSYLGRWRPGPGHRTFLHSGHGYRQLLNRAGFDNVKLFCAIPDYRSPKFMVPLDEVSYAYYRRHFGTGPVSGIRDVLIRAMGHCGLDKYLVHSFVLTAS